MTSKVFSRFMAPGHGRDFYKDLRARDDSVDVALQSVERQVMGPEEEDHTGPVRHIEIPARDGLPTRRMAIMTFPHLCLWSGMTESRQRTQPGRRDGNIKTNEQLRSQAPPGLVPNGKQRRPGRGCMVTSHNTVKAHRMHSWPAWCQVAPRRRRNGDGLMSQISTTSSGTSTTTTRALGYGASCWRGSCTWRELMHSWGPSSMSYEC
jgi:hypothetical protein